MHILQIIHGYPPTYNAGSEVYTQTLSEALAKEHQVSIFTREENPYCADFALRLEKRRERLTIYFLNLPREKDGFQHPELDLIFRKLLTDLQPDIAHIGHLNHLSTGLVKELTQAGIPTIFTLHDFWLMCPRGQFLQVNFAQQPFYQLCSGQENRTCARQCYNRFFADRESREADETYWSGWVNRRMQATQALSRQVGHFIAPSRYLRERFIRDFSIPPEKISYLDYGFDQDRLQGRKRNEEDRFTFGYIGTHIPAKGINLLLQAFSQVKGKVQLRIWGRPDGQSTVALQQMADMCPHPVEFLGEYANPALIPQVFNRVDTIVVPSIWMENSPLVIHEAQGAQISVITANAGGMAEYVQHHINGLLFQHRDEKSLTKQLQYAVDHPQEMKQLGKRGYLYDPDGQIPDIQTHVDAVEDLYRKILATPLLSEST